MPSAFLHADLVVGAAASAAMAGAIVATSINAAIAVLTARIMGFLLF